MRPIDGLATVPDREFLALCLDWDLIRPEDGREDIAKIRSLIQRLCAVAVDIAVVSELPVDIVDAGLRARPDVEGHLLLFPSGGSETYVVGPQGPRLLGRRQVSEQEGARLAAAATSLRDEMVAQGLEVALTSAGLNGWRLTLPVEGSGNARDLVKLARRELRAAGLPSARVKADRRVVYLSHGDRLSGIRDALERVTNEPGRQPSDVAIVAEDMEDVAGRRAGRGGRDAPVVIGAARRARATVLSLLQDQLGRRTAATYARFPQPIDDPSWRLEVAGFDPFREREAETLLTVGNGESGTRGCIEEGSGASTPGTFVAGVFGDGTGELRIRQPVPAPDWVGLRLLVGGAPLSLASGETIEHHRILDMRHGVLYRYWRQRDGMGRTIMVRTARFASLADRQVLALRAEASTENYSGRLAWQAAVGISHAGAAVREAEIQDLPDARLVMRTAGRNGGGHVLALATRPVSGSPVVGYVEQGRDVIGGLLEPGDPATVDRLAALVSARTRVPSSGAAGRALERAARLGYDELLRRHRAAWEERWGDADLVVEGDPADQTALRFSIFHMISSAHPTKESASVGARGLSGMSYFQHVFWDTEIFVLPFFIYTHPRTARTLLAYRFRNLPGAQAKAERLGHRGALYPWESADRGEEATPPYGRGPGGEMVPILSGVMEHHISADVAWATWEYWKATGDDVFMAAMGVEMLLETARFWASRAAADEAGRYHIRLVVGPDEYHEAVDDNAYTNVLARWNIRRGLEAWGWLRRVDSGYADELWNRLELSTTELEDWAKVADGMVDNFDSQSLLYEQFAGFYEMDDLPVEKLRPRPMAADILLGRDVTLRSKVVKQADVVMLMHVLSDEADSEVVAANYDYYEPLTSHGSSLSPGMHAAVAARVGRIDDAVASFKMATEIDLGDTMGNAARGLHLATMGSLWQAAVSGFAGIRRRDEALVVDPHLPPSWNALSVPLLFRGARLKFSYQRGDGSLDLGITIERTSVRIVLDEVERILHPGRHLFCRDGGGRWRAVDE